MYSFKYIIIFLSSAFIWIPFSSDDWAILTLFGIKIYWFLIVAAFSASLLAADIDEAGKELSFLVIILGMLTCPAWIIIRRVFIKKEEVTFYDIGEPLVYENSTLEGIDVLNARYHAFATYDDGTRYLFRRENEWKIIIPKCKEELERNCELSHVELEDEELNKTEFSIGSQLYIEAYKITLREDGELKISKFNSPRYEFPEGHQFE